LAEKKAQSGNTLAGRLARLGLKGDSDFVLHLPLRYEDETRITPLCDARPGVAAQFEVEVTDCEVAYRPRRQLIARVRDAGGVLSLRFLNFYPSQQKVLQPARACASSAKCTRATSGPRSSTRASMWWRPAKPCPRG
jgi:ATP-dependent DNA helicase RecG